MLVRNRITGEVIKSYPSLREYFEESAQFGEEQKQVLVAPRERANGPVAHGLRVNDSIMEGIRVDRGAVSAVLNSVVLTNAAITETDLRGSQFVSCDLRAGSLIGINAQGVDFFNTNLMGATLSGDFRGTIFRNCNLTGADLSAATLGAGAALHDCVLKQAVLPRRKLVDVTGDLNDHNFSGSLLFDAALTVANLEAQAYSLLIKERTDLCEELWSPTGIFPANYYEWAMGVLASHIIKNGDSVSGDFLEAIVGVVDIPELRTLLEAIRNEEEEGI